MMVTKTQHLIDMYGDKAQQVLAATTRNKQTIHDIIVEEWLNDDHMPNIPEHLRDVICGRAIIHNAGEVSWCTRKPGHDGDCHTGWQPTTQPLGHHGNQN